MDENDIIIELANRLGIAVGDIFNIFSESIRGIAVLNMISLVIFCIGVILIFKLVYTIVKKSEYGGDNDITYTDFDGDDWFSVAMVCVVLMFVWMVFMTILTECVGSFMFPEYVAIKQMLMTISGN